LSQEWIIAKTSYIIFLPKYFFFCSILPISHPHPFHIAFAMSCQSKMLESWTFFLKWYREILIKNTICTCRCGCRLKSIILIYHDTIRNIWQDARVGLSIDSIIPPRDTKKNAIGIDFNNSLRSFCFYMFVGNDESDLISTTM